MGADKFSNCKDWSMMSLIRKLSNVNPQFRKEFADVFWGRTRILLQEEETYDSLPLFPDFIAERPAICSGIRELKVLLFLRSITFDNDEEEDRFLEFCDAISTLPSLEVLSITIWIYEDEDEFLDVESRTHRCFKAIQNLPVKKKFELKLDMMDNGMRDWEAFEEERERIEKKWARDLWEIMLPNTLRPSKDTSAKGKYPRSRPKADLTDVGTEDLAVKMAADAVGSISDDETEYETADEGSSWWRGNRPNS